MESLQGSIIRELFKLIKKDPDIIPFAGGAPDNSTFPIEDMAQIVADVFRDDPISLLQYGAAEGYMPLREAMREHLTKTQGMQLENDEIFTISGAQQGADLTAKLFLNEGDTILVESPSFVGCLNAYRSYGANLHGIPMETDGMNIDKLEHALKIQPNVRLIYTIPNFQNPSGVTTSLEKRKAIYALAQKYNVLILEDNPYGELRFAGEHIPAIKSLDADGRVIYIASFSKTIAPALRVGSIVFPKAIADRVNVAKQCTDVHTTVLMQHLCYTLLTKWDYAGHLARATALYKRKADLMLDAMAAHFHPSIQYTRPEGGMFVMAFLPDGMDSYPFVMKAINRKVACVPGAAFGVDTSAPASGFRMSFTSPPEEKIAKGIEILGKLTHEWIK